MQRYEILYERCFVEIKGYKTEIIANDPKGAEEILLWTVRNEQEIKSHEIFSEKKCGGIKIFSTEEISRSI